MEAYEQKLKVQKETMKLRGRDAPRAINAVLSMAYYARICQMFTRSRTTMFTHSGDARFSVELRTHTLKIWVIQEGAVSFTQPV